MTTLTLISYIIGGIAVLTAAVALIRLFWQAFTEPVQAKRRHTHAYTIVLNAETWQTSTTSDYSFKDSSSVRASKPDLVKQ